MNPGPRYDQDHRRRRAMLAPAVSSGTVPCARCGILILPGQAWDLGHRDDGPGYAGAEHRGCNRTAGARVGRERAELARRANERRRYLPIVEARLAVSVAEDRRRVSIGAAYRLEAWGVAVLELAGYRSTARAMGHLDGLVGDLPVAGDVVADPRAPAEVLRPSRARLVNRPGSTGGSVLARRLEHACTSEV